MLAVYPPFGNPVNVISNSVIRSLSSINLASPRTGEGSGTDGGVEGGGVSRMQTAALFDFPDPRRIAVRPVFCIADIMAEGGVVDVVVNILFGRENSVFCMPGNFDSAPEMSLMQVLQVMSTEKVAW